MRTLIAFLVAPLFPGSILLFLSLINSNADEGIWIFAYSALVAYPLALVLGVPTYIWMKKHRRNGLLEYLIFGSLFSIAPIAYFILFPKLFSYESMKFSMPNVGLALLIILAGVGAAFIFWLIARPDLRVKKG